MSLISNTHVCIARVRGDENRFHVVDPDDRFGDYAVRVIYEPDENRRLVLTLCREAAEQLANDILTVLQDADTGFAETQEKITAQRLANGGGSPPEADAVAPTEGH